MMDLCDSTVYDMSYQLLCGSRIRHRAGSYTEAASDLKSKGNTNALILAYVLEYHVMDSSALLSKKALI